MTKRPNPNRDRYNRKKVPELIDTIVVGSGIGGLTTAGLLARTGQRVLVLEQHYLAGGSTHCFEDHGCEFDTGIHYIGKPHNRMKILSLITDGDIEWDKLGNEDNNYVYDEIYFKDHHTQYNFPAGEENLINALADEFPDEEEGIRRYFALVKKVAKKDMFFNLKIFPQWIANFLLKWVYTDFLKWTNRTAYEVVSEFTDNEHLKSVLCGQFGDCGPPPKEGSFFMHASVVNHYLEGGWYVKGGTGNIANKIIPVIERMGGRVLTTAPVKEIIIADGTARGVRMQNGDLIRANNVVCATGLLTGFNRLINYDNSYTRMMKEFVNRVGPSTTYIYLFVKMKGSPEELRLRSANIWHYPHGDYSRMLEEYYKDPLTAEMPLFIGFPSAKDSTWTTRFPGISNAVILTAAKYEWFQEWKDDRPMHRRQEYQDKKDQFAQKMLKELFIHYPQLKDKILHTEVGTPITFNHYIGSQFGECYGIDGKAIRYSNNHCLRPQTGIKNLYLTGQDITTLGFTGAMMAGVLTTHAMLGYGHPLDLLTRDNLIQDIHNYGL